MIPRNGKHTQACRNAFLRHLDDCAQCGRTLRVGGAVHADTARRKLCEIGCACLDELAIARRNDNEANAQAAA